MKRSKNNVIRCLIWLRNGISFCFTWFVLLVAVLCRVRRIEAVPVTVLLRLFLFVCGGVVLFCLWFSPFPVQKMRFFSRLTGFFVLFVPYELLGFYLIGLFRRSETTLPKMLVFLCITLALYLLCLWIDRRVCAGEGVRYTESLKRYQQRKEKDDADK